MNCRNVNVPKMWADFNCSLFIIIINDDIIKLALFVDEIMLFLSRHQNPANSIYSSHIRLKTLRTNFSPIMRNPTLKFIGFYCI